MAYRCPHCGGKVKKRSIGGLAGLITGLFLVVVGIVIFVLIPIIGWIVGPCLIVVGLLSGGKPHWVCSQCKAMIGRA